MWKEKRKSISICMLLILLPAVFLGAYDTAEADEIVIVPIGTITEEPAPEPPAQPEPEPPSPPAPETEPVPEPEPPTPAPAPETPTPAPSAAPTAPPEDVLGASDDEGFEDDEEPPEEEEPTIEYPSIELKWKLSPGNEHLYAGDEITLQAEIEPADGLRLQWQVAVKPTDELKEDEEEWVNIDGENAQSLIFAVASHMQDWRWRLRVTLENGEECFSDEMMLPGTIRVREEDEPEEELLEEDDDALSEEGDEASQDEILPTADINLLADIYADEITYGTEITLVANIVNARDNMELQWQYAVYPEDEEAEITEESWIDVPDANETTHTYIMDEENESWAWRLLITVPEDVEEMEVDGEPLDAADGDAMPVEEHMEGELELAPSEEEVPEPDAEETQEEPAPTDIVE